MRAATVMEAGQAPTYTSFRDPEPSDDQTVVPVVAAALHQLVRTRASGQHYSSAVEPPFVVGVDGVVRLGDGTVAYVPSVAEPFGTFAELAPVRLDRLTALPVGLNPAVGAAIVNPASSSWLPLRAFMEPGMTVLVIGATGFSGGLAVEIARALGAGRVVAAGRAGASLDATRDLGADAVVDLQSELGAAYQSAANGFDVVLDYLWGDAASQSLAALTSTGIDPDRPLEYVNIGQLAGASIDLGASLLRGSNVRVSGSGIGSKSEQRFREAAAAVLGLAATGAIHAIFEQHALATVNSTWEDASRVVYTP